MTTELVYRVQHHRTTEGPYGDFHPAIENMIYAHQSDKHPGPRNPISGLADTWSRGQLFGFRSREQLDDWFKGWKLRLHDAGYVIKVLKVREDLINHGTNQLCFWPEGVFEEVETLPVVRGRKPADSSAPSGRFGSGPDEDEEPEFEVQPSSLEIDFSAFLRSYGSLTLRA